MHLLLIVDLLQNNAATTACLSLEQKSYLWIVTVWCDGVGARAVQNSADSMLFD
jgi:hypothetical protein